jgi:ABC-2 type transport system ATP-binding protein
LREAGTTVIITSHYLEEIDALADQLAIIDKGLVIANGTPNELKDKVGGDRITLRIQEFASEQTAQQVKQLVSGLEFVETVIINSAQGNSLNLVVKSQGNYLSTIEQSIQNAGFPIFSLSQSRPSLDDVYLAATGKTLMDAEIEAVSKRDLKQEQKQQMK